MTRATAYQKHHTKARQRRRLIAQERLARDRRQAQQAAEALQQALDDLGLPEDLVIEIEGHVGRSPDGIRETSFDARICASASLCPPASASRSAIVVSATPRYPKTSPAMAIPLPAIRLAVRLISESAR